MWNKRRSVLLSRVCVIFFAALLALFDGWSVLVVVGTVDYELVLRRDIVVEAALGWCASIFLYLILWELWRLMRHIGAGRVFTEENVALLRVVSWCCMAVAGFALLATAWIWMRYLLFWMLLVVAMAAAFMGLIVRIVKNCFAEAVAMKSELDLTV